MSQLISVTLSEEFSPLGGQIIYLNYGWDEEAGTVNTVRMEVPFGAENIYHDHGVPVFASGDSL